MLTKITSKGRFWILGTGLFVIAAYLSVALASNNSATFARTTDSENNEQVEAISDSLAAAAGTGTSSTEAPEARPEERLSNPASSNRRGSQEIQYRNRLAQVSKVAESTDVNDVQVEKASAEEPISFKDSVDSNPLAPSIDPDTPGIARTALTADFESLVGSGVDVSSAVRHIDERVSDGKYGQNVIRK